jgi:hypothetical protein
MCGRTRTTIDLDLAVRRAMEGRRVHSKHFTLEFTPDFTPQG